MVLNNKYGVKTKGNAGGLTVNIHDKGEKTQRRPVNGSIIKIYQNRASITVSFFAPDFLRPSVGENAYEDKPQLTTNKTGVIL